MAINPHAPRPGPRRSRRHRPASNTGVPLRWLALSVVLGGLAGLRLGHRPAEGLQVPPLRPAPERSAQPPGIPGSQPQGHSEGEQHDYERRDVSVAWIFGVILLLAVAGLGIQLMMTGYLGHLKQEAATTDLWQPQPRPASPAPPLPEPQLQVSPPAELIASRQKEDAALNSYGWLDRAAGVTRIPIGRAMDLLLERGLPVRAGDTGGQAGPSSFELMQQRPQHREPEIQGDQ